jgi:hypothetical protein
MHNGSREHNKVLGTVTLGNHYSFVSVNHF